MPALLALSFVLSPAQSQDLAKHVYPLAKTLKCPAVVTDIIDFPESKQWSEVAKSLVESWYPRLTELLATDGRDPISGKDTGNKFKEPKQIKLIFKKTLRVPAYTTGSTITINGDWITKHPDDLGMVVHELTHVVQQYGDNNNAPGWLVEGIADYIRWWRYEPELHAGPGRTKVNPTKANYTDAYRTTAVWLAWCGRKYDMRLVPALDKSMRDGKDPMTMFNNLTGHSADELWKEFVATLK